VVGEALTFGEASWQVANAGQVAELPYRAGGSKRGNLLVVDFDLTNNGGEAVTPCTEPMVLSDNEERELRPVPRAVQTRPRASS
jgi:hypothetical protein